MPFFKRRFGGFRRKRRFGRMFRRKGLRRKIKRVSRRLSGIIGASVQWKVTSVDAVSSGGLISCVHNSTGSSTSNGVLFLSGMVQGTDSYQRTGNRVQLLRLTMRGFTYPAVANTLPPAYNTGRIVLVAIPDNNGQGLATSNSCTDWTSLLADWNTGNLSNVLSTWRPDKVPKKVRIIKDFRINPFNVDIAGTTGLSAVSYGRGVQWKFSVNLRKVFRNAYTTYNNTTQSTTTCEANHLAMFFMQSNATPADAGSLASVLCYKLSFLP